MIAEDVLDLEEHERRLRCGAYRPAECRRCGGAMHIHEYRGRLLLGEPDGSTQVAIFQCADREQCGAVIRVLPAFLARRLWRAWATVEHAVAEAEARPEEGGETANAVPERTVRRWRNRLASSAAVLVVVLGTAADTLPAVRSLIAAVGLDGTRLDVVTQYASTVTPAPSKGMRLATVSAVVHRLTPGVRLM